MKSSNISFDLLICVDCGHIQKKILTDWSANQYYDNNYQYQIDDGEELFFSEQGVESQLRSASQYSIFKKITNKVSFSSALDIGSGRGLFLKRAVDSLPHVKFSCFEMSENYRSYLEKIVPPENITIKYINNLPKNYFDIITALDVLEHVDNIDSFMKDIKRLLNKGGYLFLQVPDLEKATFDWLLADHLSHFHIRTLTQLLSIYGFEVIKICNTFIDGAIQVLARQVNLTKNYSNVVDQNPLSITFFENHQKYYNKYLNFTAEVWKNFNKICIFGTGTAASIIPIYCNINVNKIYSFIDQNPYRIGKTHLNKPIISIESIPRDIDAIFLGVSPQNVSTIMNVMNKWQEKTFYVK